MEKKTVIKESFHSCLILHIRYLSYNLYDSYQVRHLFWWTIGIFRCDLFKWRNSV